MSKATHASHRLSLTTAGTRGEVGLQAA